MSFLIVILMMTVAVVAVVGSYDAYEKDRAPRFVEDVARHSRRSKGHREARGYVEQCRPTNLEKERLGHVNVLAFVDPSWYYSYRQMIMLELLQKRLEKSGFSNILFFVVTPPPNMPEDSAENDAEIKTWREISKNMLESEYFLDAREFLFNNAIENKKNISYIQDTHELGIWENFHASKDEVVIVDRCGKLTYQVIIPWSILYFPYVKAAILSTYKDDPCGPCDEYSPTIYNSIDYEELLLKTTDTGVTEIHNNLNLYTEGTVNDLETATITFDESERNKDENVTSTISPIEVNTYKSTIYDITTTDTSTISIETTENVKVDNDTFATETSIAITTEVAMEREEAQTSTTSILEVTENYEEMGSGVPPSEQINANNDATFFTMENSVVNWETNHEDRPREPEASLESTKVNEDHRQSDGNIEQQELKLQRDESLPLRIILYAPHLHEENGTLKAYTHLVLKTRNPDYHDHFHSKSTNSNEEPITFKQSDSTVLDNKKLSDYVHSKNESPGMYGEIADYWRITDEEELNNKNENTEFTDYDDATAEDTGGDVDDSVDSESSILKPNDIDTIESDTNIKSNNELDEFTQQKLIDHYSKLLKWLYYIL